MGAAGLARFLHAVATGLTVVSCSAAAQFVAPDAFPDMSWQSAGAFVGLVRTAVGRVVAVEFGTTDEPQRLAAGGGDADGGDEVWCPVVAQAGGALPVDDTARVLT